MKRKDFFKSLLGLAITPLALSQTAEEPKNPKCLAYSSDGKNWRSYENGKLIKQAQFPEDLEYYFQTEYPLTYEEASEYYDLQLHKRMIEERYYYFKNIWHEV